MFRVIGCIVGEHNLGLVVLAGVLCLFACSTAMGAVGRARASMGRVRAMWIAGAGFAAGCGIWATHFVAMLAFRSAFPIGYDISLTILSVVIAITLCSTGFAVAVLRGAPALGGAVAGAAIGTMHYVGMAALRAPVLESWDLGYVAASLAIGIMAMAVGMRVVMRGESARTYAFGALTFTLAICTMHFTGMAAVTFAYDPLIPAVTGILEPTALAIAVAAVAALILGIGMILAVVDHQMALRAAGEAARLRVYVNELERTKAELELSVQERALALTKADAASQSKSAFLAAMSHELRTPLNAIIGFSEIMKTQAFGPIGDAHYGSYAEDIHASGKHLLSLIDDILDLSRLDAGKAELREQPVSIEDIAADCLRMVGRQAEERGLRLARDIAPDLPRVLADERRLKQVLLNLLTNAVKFTPSGGTVTVRTRLEGDGLALAVEDTGIGIAPGAIAKAFENFGQIDSTVARKGGGAGLGLPLARQLIELHGGKLILRSVVDVGTIATALVPASRVLARTKSAAA